MLPQPPDNYRGPFPPRDPRLPLITNAHDSGEAFSKTEQTHAMQHRAMDKFATRHAPLQEIHQDRLGLIGGPDGGHQHGAPMAMDFAEHEADSDDDHSVYTMFQKGHRRYDLQPRSPYQSSERIAIEDEPRPPPTEEDESQDPGSRGNNDGGDPHPPEEPRGGALKTIGEWMKWAMSHDPDAHQHDGDYSYYGEKEERKPDAYDLYGKEETRGSYSWHSPTPDMPATPPPAAKAKAKPRASSSSSAGAVASSSAGAASAGASSSSHQRPFVDVGPYQGTVEVSDEEPYEPNQPTAPARRRRKTALEKAQELAAAADKYGRTKQFDDPKRQPPKPRGG